MYRLSKPLLVCYLFHGEWGDTCLSVWSEQRNLTTGHLHSLFFFPTLTHHCTIYTEYHSLSKNFIILCRKILLDIPLRLCYSIQAFKRIEYRGVEQLVARRAHNPEVAGSSPASATNK